MRAFGFLFLSCLVAFAQVPSPSATASAVRAQAVEASGGATAIEAIKDYTGSGTITYFEREREQSGPVTVKSFAGDFVRLDASLNNETHTWVLRGLSGKSKQGQGKSNRLSSEVALSLRNFSLPIAVVAFSKVQDLSLNVKEGDSSTRHRLAIVSGPTKATTEYEIDAQTGRVSRVASSVRARTNIAPILQEFVYADYRVVDGVLMPFVIEEWNGGRLALRVQLEKVIVNSGLSATDFILE